MTLDYMCIRGTHVAVKQHAYVKDQRCAAVADDRMV